MPGTCCSCCSHSSRRRAWRVCCRVLELEVELEAVRCHDGQAVTGSAYIFKHRTVDQWATTETERVRTAAGPAGRRAGHVLFVYARRTIPIGRFVQIEENGCNLRSSMNCSLFAPQIRPELRSNFLLWGANKLQFMLDRKSHLFSSICTNPSIGMRAACWGFGLVSFGFWAGRLAYFFLGQAVARFTVIVKKEIKLSGSRKDSHTLSLYL